MALFTDFFPEGGGNNIEQSTLTVFGPREDGWTILPPAGAGSSNPVGSSNFSRANPPGAGSLAANQLVRVEVMGRILTGRILTLTEGGNANGRILWDDPANYPFTMGVNGAVISQIMTPGDSVIIGDLVIGGDGDVTLGGDGTFIGDLTGDVTGDVTGNINGDVVNAMGDVIVDSSEATFNGNATTATTLQNARNFSINGDSGAGMGDITAATVSFNGSADVVLDATVDDGAIGTAKIADNAVNATKINSDVAGGGLLQETTGALGVNIGSGTNQAGLTINNDVLGINVGAGLHIDGGALAINTLNVNNTHSVSTNVAGEPTVAQVVTALAAVAANFGTLEAGDFVLATSTDDMVQTFIYIGNTNISLPGTVPADDLIPLGSGTGAIASITPGSGLVGDQPLTGAVTLNIGAGDGITVNDNNITLNLNSNSTNQLTVTSDGLGVTTAAIADGGTGLATADQIHTFVTGLTEGTDNTVPKFGTTEGDLVDSNITDDGTTIEIGGTTLDVNAVVDIDSPGAVTIDTAAAGNGDITLTSGGTGSITASSGGDITLTTTANGAVGIASGGTGNLSLNANMGEIRIAGADIATTATDDEPLNLIVGADGHLMTTTRDTSGFNVVVSNANSNLTTVTHGDLVVLVPITADRNMNLPASPNIGDSIKISNLSATGTGSGTNRWSVGTTGDRIMGTQLTTPFVLDDNTASFEMVFTGGVYGWVIIGAN